MTSIFYLYEDNDKYYKAKSLKEVKDYFKNKNYELWERSLNPSYYEVYEFENGYTPKELSIQFGINPFLFDQNKKYAIFERFLEIENYEDPIEKLDKYIEENGKKVDKYIQYDYDCGFYICEDKIFSDRTGKYVFIKEVEKILKNIKKF